MDASNKRDHRGAMRGILLACVAFGLFSTADMVVKYLSHDYTVFQTLFVGSLVAMGPVLLVARQTDILGSLAPNSLLLCALRALLMTGSILAVVWSLVWLSLAEAYALVFTAPLLVVTLARFILRERVELVQWVAVILGFAGVLVMLRPGEIILGPGHFLAMASALFWAFGLILLRWIGETETPGALIVTLLVTMMLIAGPLAAIFWVSPENPVDWLLFALLGMMTGFGQFALILAFRSAPASLVSPFQYTQMLWAVVFGIMVFGDVPDMIMLMGAAMVIASGLWIAKSHQTEEARIVEDVPKGEEAQNVTAGFTVDLKAPKVADLSTEKPG